MAQLGKGKLNYRCPSCFMRDLDIDMFYNKDTKIYSCIRCQYRGTEEDVLKKNEMARFRYGAMHKRFDKFDFDCIAEARWYKEVWNGKKKKRNRRASLL